MQRIIEKHITEDKIIDKQQCIDVLNTDGLKIVNVDNLEFTENHNFTTHTGKNRMMLFSPLLKGSLSFDTNKKLIKWSLNIDSLIVKTAFTFTTLTLIWQFLIQDVWIKSIFVGGIFGLIIFGINWFVLNEKLDKLTNEITRK